MSRDQPVFNGPAIVPITLAALVAVHVGRSFLSESADTWVILANAFIPVRLQGEVLPGGELAMVTSFLTHALLHGDVTHLLINCGWLLAFGTIVARRVTAIGFLVLLALTAIAGAALFLLCNWGLAQPMVGASGAISGLMGAAVRFIFQSRELAQAAGGRSMTLAELARDPRARLMIGSWLVINLLFGLVLGKLFTEGGIAWEAHLGGFILGLLLFPWFDIARQRAPLGAAGADAGPTAH